LSEVAGRTAPSRVWLLVVILMIGLALAGPVVMVRDQLADRAGEPTAAEGSQSARP